MGESDRSRTLSEAVLLLLNDWQGRAKKADQRGLLHAVRHDGDAFRFVQSIFDTVALPHDVFASASGLRDLASETPESLPPRLKLALQVSGVASTGLPWGVIPVVKQRFRAHLSDIVLTSAAGLSGGQVPELLLPEAVGELTAATNADRAIKVVQRPGISEITVAVETLVPHPGVWFSDETGHTAALHRLAQNCANNGVRLNLTARSFDRLLLLPALAAELLQNPDLGDLRIGVHVLIELPESVALAEELLALKTPRLTVILSTASIAGVEQIAAINHGLPVPVLEEVAERDAAALRLLNLLRGSAESSLPVEFESTDAFTLALVSVFSGAGTGTANTQLPLRLRMGVTPELEFLQHAKQPAVAVCPVASAANFEAATSTVLLTLAEAVDDAGPLALNEKIFSEAGYDQHLQNALRERAFAAFESYQQPAPISHRQQDRKHEWTPSGQQTASFYRPPASVSGSTTAGLTAAVLQLSQMPTGEIRLQKTAAPQTIPVLSKTGFANEPASDATLASNRAWVSEQMHKTHTPEAALPNAQGQLSWHEFSEQQRAALMLRAALALAAARDRFFTALAGDRAISAAEADHEISYAIDAARYYAARAEGLRAVRGASFEADEKILLVFGARTRFSDFAEAVTAVIATGATAQVFLAPTLENAATVFYEEWILAGLPQDAIELHTGQAQHFADSVLLAAEDLRLKRALIYAAPKLLAKIRFLRPELKISAHNTAISAAVVTVSADLTAAAKTITKSAFGFAGVDAGQTTAVITCGKEFKQKRFLKLLKDAALNFAPVELAAELTEESDPAALQALTTLAAGEKWVLKPQQLDDEGLVWRVGIRAGVKPGATFWQAARGLPVIGVTHTATIDEAVALQNAVFDKGVAALHSHNEAETIVWLENSTAQTLAVNKGTTFAQIERMPLGANAEAGTVWGMAGGPNRLTAMGTWHLRAGSQSDTLHLRGLPANVTKLIEAAQPELDYKDFDRLRRAALTDTLIWRTTMNSARDVAGLQTEHNLLRYKPLEVHVRAAADAPLHELLRVLIAGVLSGANITLSCANTLPVLLDDALYSLGVNAKFESDDEWFAAVLHDPPSAARIRFIGSGGALAAEQASFHPGLGVIAEPVTLAGVTELLCFVREQAVSINATRHGFRAQTPALDEWITSLSR